MNIQINSLTNTPFKISFSNLYAKIALISSESFAFVIRLGKRSSHFTQKKKIFNNILKYDKLLQLSFDQSLLNNHNAKKQKCEIMLYKFKFQSEKQSKQLIGMASIAISTDMFNQQIKKLRMTNSFDKEAFLQCTVKIQLGEADLSVLNESIISSFFMKTEPNFTNQIWSSRCKLEDSNQIAKNQASFEISMQNNITKDHYPSPQSIKIQNSVLQTPKGESSFRSTINPQQQGKQQNQIKKYKQKIKIKEQISEIHESLEEKHNLVEICDTLKRQNQILIKKVQNLQNKVLNQSAVSNKSSIVSQDKSRSGTARIIKQTSMIKKNIPIPLISLEDQLQLRFGCKQSQRSDRKSQHQYLNQISSLQTSRISRIKINRTKSIDHENNQYLTSLQTARQSEINQMLIKLQKKETNSYKKGDIKEKNGLKIIKNIQITCKPDKNRDNPRQNQSINQSNSEINSQSYFKNSGKKKYQMIGLVRSPEQSINSAIVQKQQRQDRKIQINGLVLQQNFQQINSRNSRNSQDKNQDELNIVFSSVASPRESHQSYTIQFLDNKNDQSFIKHIKKQGNQQKNLQNLVEVKQNLPNKKLFTFKDKYRKKITLQQLDIETQQRFRKNQRDLKKANTQLLHDNHELRKKIKNFQQQKNQNKHLTHNHLDQLKKQIQRINSLLQIALKDKSFIESQFNEVSAKCIFLQLENNKLKKELKQQKIHHELYLKMIDQNNNHQKQTNPIYQKQTNSVHSKQANSIHLLSSNTKRIFLNDDSKNSSIDAKNSNHNHPDIKSILNFSIREDISSRNLTNIKSPKDLTTIKQPEKVETNIETKIFIKNTESIVRKSSNTVQKTNFGNQKKQTPKVPSSAVSKIRQNSAQTTPRSSIMNQHNSQKNQSNTSQYLSRNAIERSKLILQKQP